ncbi:DUF4397 domain-containing protein [Chitinophaga sancti]|uniref:DUF4397 domain-containing protein n=1 Tax=Chitinophaga sancti TaxID=1004 RepID=A0A1K1LU95_9BACT|nr:DUF4397 domain-containing protein [Chitinophaga sancti]WQD64848.1 DUF4397 domain-containing protein [Chitinophaga sancti]WQG89528.1 DUF4397 domain-containing protein [Chitinophaga sancti]SFW14427.1 protein of unknown function [Chitinophaga sancti]
MVTSKRFGAVAALLAMVTGFTACLKTENTTPSRPVAAFVVINGISSAAKLDFYDNSTKIKDSVSTGFAGYNYQAYGGVHIFELKRYATGTTVVSTSAATYDSLNYYTLVAFGDSTSPVFYPIKDSEFNGANTANLNIRFWNLSSNIGPVDLYLNATKVDSNVTFSMSRPTTVFKALSTVTSATSITVKKAGTSTVVATNNSSTTQLSVSGVYTIFLTGNANVTTGSLAPYVGYIKSYY